jgi:HAD hydrolase, family IIB
MKTLYISDLDGTLLQSNGTPSEFTVKTINDLIGKGMNITFATARSYSSAAKILPLFDLRIPAATMNGVFLTDTAGGTQKRVCFINRGAAMNVTDIMVDHGRPPFAYTYTRSGFLDVQYTVNKYDYERKFIADRKALYHKFDYTKQYHISDRVVYINGLDKKETIESICRELDEVSGIRYSAYLDTYSDGLYFLEVYSVSGGKKNAAAALKEMYGFDRVVAFGDNGNDAEVMSWADESIAVGNAQEAALKVADKVIGSNDSDGVAKYLLEQYEKGNF